MNKTNEKILEKAIVMIQNRQFDRKWDSLFETSTEQTNNLICNLYFKAMSCESLRCQIKANASYMPTLLLKGLNIV